MSSPPLPDPRRPASAGNLFFVDFRNLRIRKIAVNGTITTVAGTGKFTLSGDGEPATAADSFPGFLTFGPDGSLYFTDDAVPGFGGYPVCEK